MQLGSKLIALLRRNSANAQSNLNACEASGIKSEEERGGVKERESDELCFKAATQFR